jgi:hypothetical protein
VSKPREHLFTFAGAGEREFQVQGKYLRIMSAPVGDVFVKLDSSSEIQLGAGQQLPDDDGFKRVNIRTLVAQTVRFITSDSRIDDDRANVALSVSATVEGGTAVQAPPVVEVAAGTTVKIADSNADRIELRVALKSDSASHVWLGPAGVDDEEGGLLEPGTIDYIALVGELYAHNPGATSVFVSVLDIESP